MTRIGFPAALRCELLKARRSKVPALTGLGITIAPIVAALFMIIMKDPEKARDWGLITTKAQIFGGHADWPTLLGLLAQEVAVGGWLLFSLLTAWIFGREFSDRTVKTLLAVPTSRRATVLAKIAVVALLSAGLAAWVLVIGVVLGAVIGLPGGSAAVLGEGALRVALITALTVALLPPIALAAGVGRGYMAPLALALLLLVMAQITAATGWGEWFPWTVPALLSGAAGPDAAAVGPGSYLVIVAVAIIGLISTLAWWDRADHTT